MRRYWLVSALSVLGSVQLACAQAPVVERALKTPPGQGVRVGIYTSIRSDCTSGPLPAIRLVHAPLHGSVTVRRAMLKATNIKQCLAIDAPALVAFYRAGTDFAGADDFDLEITFAGGRVEIQRFHMRATGARQGI